MVTTMLGLLVLVSALVGHSWAGTSDHRYQKGEHVELWVNKVRETIVRVRQSHDCHFD